MRTTDEETGEGSSDRVESMRTELREVALIKRKEDRAFSWNKNRTNLGHCPGDDLFSIEYINERTMLLKNKRISLRDYRYLPNALIQVCFSDIINFLQNFSRINMLKSTKLFVTQKNYENVSNNNNNT